MNLQSKTLSLKPTALATSVALAATLALAPAAAWANGNAVFEKSEAVYGMLSSKGAVEELYVVNQFDIEKAGTLEDFGDYDRIENLTDKKEISTSDDKQTVEVDEGVFWYEGDIDDGDLPWKFDVHYTLDGSEVAADKLAGATGDVGVSINVVPNPEAAEAFSKAYMLQVSFTAPAKRCKNCAVSEGGTVVNAGSDRRVSFTVMPGKEASLTFTAEAEHFEMSGLSISGALASKDVEPASFASAENGAVEGVVFSLSTPAIEVPEEKAEVAAEPEKNFIERVLALFGM